MTVESPRRLWNKQGRTVANGRAYVSVRITEDLLQRLATYGNSANLTLAETVRTVLELGLDGAK